MITVRGKLKKAAAFVLALITGGVLACAATMLWFKTSTADIPVSSVPPDTVIEGEDFVLSVTNIEELIKPAGELITTKYYYTDADTYENAKQLFGHNIPFTTDKVVFTYSGVLSVGFMLSDIHFELDNENQIITVTLPPLEVLGNEIDPDSFEYPYIEDSVFNATNMSDYTQIISELKKYKENEIIHDQSFLNECLQKSKDVLRNFFTISDMTKDYTVEFK